MTAALPAGRWVVERGRRVFVAADPNWAPVDAPILWHPDQLWQTIAANLAADGYVDDTPVTGLECINGCGCLLAPAERCPACLLWANLDAARASWQTIPYVPTQVEEVAAA